MSASKDTFVARCLSGLALASDIDDAVRSWHFGDDPRELDDYLGFTEEEYDCWITRPSCIHEILACRNSGKTFTPEHREAELALAARSNTKVEDVDISRWLPKE